MTTKYGDNYMDRWNKTMQDRRFIYSKYSTPKINIEKEYTIMGVNAIISATGGSLGLFLGLSCYGVAWNILERVGAACKSVLACWKKKVHGGTESNY